MALFLRALCHDIHLIILLPYRVIILGLCDSCKGPSGLWSIPHYFISRPICSKLSQNKLINNLILFGRIHRISTLLLAFSTIFLWISKSLLFLTFSLENGKKLKDRHQTSENLEAIHSSRTNSLIRRSGNFYIIGTNSSILLKHSSILLKIKTSGNCRTQTNSNKQLSCWNLEIIAGKMFIYVNW